MTTSTITTSDGNTWLVAGPMDEPTPDELIAVMGILERLSQLSQDPDPPPLPEPDVPVVVTG